MRRAWLGGIVVFIIVLGFLFWWCYIPGISIVASPRDEGSLPVVSLRDVQSGKLARYLRVKWLWQDWFGPKPDYYQVKQFAEFRPYIADTYGLNGVVLSVAEMADFYQQEKLPYRFVAFFTTRTEKAQYLVAVQKWYGSAGRNRLVVYLTPLPSTLPGSYGDVWVSALGNDAAVAATPVLSWRDREACLSATNNRDELCDLLIAQGAGQGRLLRQWVDTNRVPLAVQRGYYWLYVMGRPRQ